MNNQQNNQKTAAEHETGKSENSGKVNIQPSEINSGAEENAPGRTAGKAEGSREIVEADLSEKENSADEAED